jgi:hypothetical protein
MLSFSTRSPVQRKEGVADGEAAVVTGSVSHLRVENVVLPSDCFARLMRRTGREC